MSLFLAGFACGALAVGLLWGVHAFLGLRF